MELDTAPETITNAIQSHKGCKETINTLEKRIVECNNNTIEVRQELENKFQNLKITSGAILKEELENHKKKLATYSNGLLQKNTALTSKLVNIEAELKKLKKENSDIKVKIGLTENESRQIKLLETQNKLLAEEKTIFIERLSRLEDENTKLKDEQTILKDENTKLKDIIEDIKIRLSHCEEQMRYTENPCISIKAV